MVSIGEAEYAAAFHTAQMATRLRKTLSDLGYPQPPTYILVDNKVAHGIATTTIEPKRTKSIDMQYHWLRNRVHKGEFIEKVRTILRIFHQTSFGQGSSSRHAPSRPRSAIFSSPSNSSRSSHSKLAPSSPSIINPLNF
jgi:hypothetical protein